MRHVYAKPNEVIEAHHTQLLTQITQGIADYHRQGVTARISPTPKAITDDYVRWVYPMNVDITSSVTFTNRLRAELTAMGFRLGAHVVHKDGSRGFEYDLVMRREVVEESFV